MSKPSEVVREQAARRYLRPSIYSRRKWVTVYVAIAARCPGAYPARSGWKKASASASVLCASPRQCFHKCAKYSAPAPTPSRPNQQLFSIRCHKNRLTSRLAFGNVKAPKNPVQTKRLPIRFTPKSYSTACHVHQPSASHVASAIHRATHRFFHRHRGRGHAHAKSTAARSARGPPRLRASGLQLPQHASCKGVRSTVA